jgi:hypothetical protein
LKTNADINGVPLRFLSQDEIKRGEPHLKVELILSKIEEIQNQIYFLKLIVFHHNLIINKEL